MDLVWYPTDLNFQEFPSSINSLDWDESPWVSRVVGEQFGESRSYNRRKVVEGLKGDHQCGKPETFLLGQKWPYDGPPVEYGADDIPLCCPRDLVGALKIGTGPAAVWRAPADGCTCSAAFPVVINEGRILTACSSTNSAWGYCDVPANHVGQILLDTLTSTSTAIIYRGESCGSLTFIGSTSGGSLWYPYPVGPATRYYINVSGTPMPFPAAVDVTFF